MRTHGPWGLLWLAGFTVSIYYFVWHARINGELRHDVLAGKPAAPAAPQLARF